MSPNTFYSRETLWCKTHLFGAWRHSLGVSFINLFSWTVVVHWPVEMSGLADSKFSAEMQIYCRVNVFMNYNVKHFTQLRSLYYQLHYTSLTSPFQFKRTKFIAVFEEWILNSSELSLPKSYWWFLRGWDTR